MVTLAECPPTPESEIPDPAFAPGFYADSVPETPEPLPQCDGSFQDCITPNGDFCEAGSGAHECEIDEPESSFVTCFDGTVATTQDACELPPPAEELFDCGDGTVATTQDACELPPPGNMESCPDMPFYMVCEGITKHHNTEGKTKIVHKTTVIQGSSAIATATSTKDTNAADVSNCKLDGSADGILQKFDSIKYQACGLFTNAQKAYSDGFLMGCTQVGNTQLICQALADTSELNMKTQLTQTQTAIQPTQAIQPATLGG